MTTERLLHGFAIFTLLATAAAPETAAQDLFGGPTFDETTGTGYIDPFTQRGTFANATGIGNAFKYESGWDDRGYRVVRWDASGTITELGTLGTDAFGFTWCRAQAVNSFGTAVGTAEQYANGAYLGERPVRWSASSTVATELENLGTDCDGLAYSSANAINSAGTVVGWTEKWVACTDFGSRAVRWDANGTAATELETLGTNAVGYGSAHASSINAQGDTIGTAQKFSNGTTLGLRAVRWNAAGTAATELGNLGVDSSGTTICQGIAINDSGTAVGTAAKYSGGTWLGERAVRWDSTGTAATELGNLGTTSSGVASSYPSAINAGGVTVGVSSKYNAGVYLGDRAVRWDPWGTSCTELTNLGTHSDGGSFSEAQAINDSGTAVGSAYAYSGANVDRHAVAWRPDGAVIDLNTLLSPTDASRWTLNLATGISDDNWVVGTGRFDPDGAGPLGPYTRMYLLHLPRFCPACAADYDNNGGIDGSDLGSFFVDYEAGDACADVDDDGGVTGSDLAYFFSLFEVGGC